LELWQGFYFSLAGFYYCSCTTVWVRWVTVFISCVREIARWPTVLVRCVRGTISLPTVFNSWARRVVRCLQSIARNLWKRKLASNASKFSKIEANVYEISDETHSEEEYIHV
jgi:hypothetical protein